MHKRIGSVNWWRFGFLFFLAFCSLLSCLPRTAAQTNNTAQSTQKGNEPIFNLHVGASLVVVRVVVHDADGNPVGNLGQADFRLLDNGKEQTIAQFELKSPASETSTPAQTAVPAHSIALLFDDLDTPLSFLTYARDAADQFLKAYLQPSDRAALITTSGTNMVDFTSDLKRLHDALFKIVPNEHGGDPRLQSRRSLQILDQLIVRLSQAPGRRSIIFVSPGFMSASQQAHVDGIIARALRSQVEISTLNPKGLETPLRETPEISPPSAGPVDTKSARQGPPPETPPSPDFVDSLDPDLLIPPEAVLREVAMATGGVYFHDNNDLKAGFHQLFGTAAPYYIVAFHPTDLKLDGRFHTLRISLTGNHAGFRLQARSGYFASKENLVAQMPPPAESQPETNPASGADAPEKEQIRQAVLSKTDLQELPVKVRTEVSQSGDDHELAVLAHLDTKSLRFHKEGKRSQNTVTFVSVIYDGNGTYVTGQQRQAKVDLPEVRLPDLFASGMNVKIIFQLKSGTYTLREVVTDSEDHHMTALSENVEIP